ncbi:MAG: hypothetical protein IJV02_00060 [Candidatus Methanomethylophilaceae archaeon]|nr:hypothetical protein [Candidatus Methanomethylophilaceae archaeon]MBR1452357.1 hypothetical protein [Candidatus Methanomethylophilaceae archaeon]
MPYVDLEDGCTHACRGEHIRWSGTVLVKVSVDFVADEPDELRSDFYDRLDDAVQEAFGNGDYEVDKDAPYGLDYEFEERDDE